ncbi:DUF6270 domain-containing protein [Lactococcus insecticola]|uniref:Uncharacterized protein n=1 Tax=Pseudolactococcus insecticola TaxID=2709158 RepID=A0A6A0B5M2_9LACT|nr:DUF6270 domain-containing protein [Lactococcus insecticola]GFH39808.1 hypothetical protein Hs20B_02060 [Lactococcus insecticola]
MKKRMVVIGSQVSTGLIENEKASFLFDLVDVQSDVSIISLMSEVIDYDHKKINSNQSLLDRSQLLSELNKDGLNNLIAVQPDIIMLDFAADIYWGVIQTESGSYLTNIEKRYSEDTVFESIKIADELHVTSDYDNYSALWIASFDRFMGFVQTYLPGTQVIINKSKFSLQLKSELTGNIYEAANKKTLDIYNKIWNLFDDYAISEFNVIGIEEIPRFTNYEESSEAVDYFAFDKDYYSSLLDKLVNIAYPNLNLAISSDLSEESLSDVETSHIKVNKASQNWNLVRNSDFLDGLDFWEDVTGEYLVKDGLLEINRKSKSSTKLESAPIAIANTMYRLAFDVWVEDVFDLPGNDLIFFARTFPDKVSNDPKFIIDSLGFHAKKENLTSGKWRHLEIDLKAEGNYIRIGSLLRGNAHIKYKNIGLYVVPEEIETDDNEVVEKENLFEKLLRPLKKNN